MLDENFLLISLYVNIYFELMNNIYFIDVNITFKITHFDITLCDFFLFFI